MVEVLTGLLISLVVVLCFGNGLLYFGEDTNTHNENISICTYNPFHYVCWYNF